MEFNPIGYIQTGFIDKFGTPRQPGLVRGARAELKIRRDLQPELALQGLEGYSHLWLIFVFHKNENLRYHPKVHPPRLNDQSIGVFATRSPHRPNPIGLSLVELVAIKSDTLILNSPDLVNGTPILDIKPYIPQIESRPEALSGWSQEVTENSIAVEFSAEAQEVLNRWQGSLPEIDLYNHIKDVVALDPRPLVYRGYEGTKSPFRQEHRVRLYDSDIHFEFTTAESAVVHRILWPFTEVPTSNS